jgi:hypothetical protein
MTLRFSRFSWNFPIRITLIVQSFQNLSSGSREEREWYKEGGVKIEEWMAKLF